MLLLLKTNDHLRGIETSLQTRHSSSSFIHMIKCCIRLIYSYERTVNSDEFNRLNSLENYKKVGTISFFNNFYSSFLKKLFIDADLYFKQNLNLFKVYVYQLFLYLNDNLSG
jgi:hypothetical protein